MQKKTLAIAGTALVVLVAAVVTAFALMGPSPDTANDAADKAAADATATDTDHWQKMQDTYAVKIQECSNEDAACLESNANVVEQINTATPRDFNDRTYATIQPNLEGTTYSTYVTNGCPSNPTASACTEIAQELNRQSYVVHYTIWQTTQK